MKIWYIQMVTLAPPFEAKRSISCKDHKPVTGFCCRSQVLCISLDELNTMVSISKLAESVKLSLVNASTPVVSNWLDRFKSISTGTVAGIKNNVNCVAVLNCK